MFFIPPNVLKELITKHNECRIGGEDEDGDIVEYDRIKVDGPNYTYVTSLATPEGDDGEDDD